MSRPATRAFSRWIRDSRGSGVESQTLSSETSVSSMSATERATIGIAKAANRSGSIVSVALLSVVERGLRRALAGDVAPRTRVVGSGVRFFRGDTAGNSSAGSGGRMRLDGENVGLFWVASCNLAHSHSPEVITRAKSSGSGLPRIFFQRSGAKLGFTKIRRIPRSETRAGGRFFWQSFRTFADRPAPET